MSSCKYHYKVFEELPNSIILQWKTAIDGTTLYTYETILTNIITSDYNKIIMDFSEVKYINSTGMGLLVKIAGKCCEISKEFCLACASEKMIALFDMLGIPSLLPIFSTLEEAFNFYCKKYNINGAISTTHDLSNDLYTNTKTIPQENIEIQEKLITEDIDDQFIEKDIKTQEVREEQNSEVIIIQEDQKPILQIIRQLGQLESSLKKINKNLEKQNKDSYGAAINYTESALKYKETNASFIILTTFLGGILLTVLTSEIKTITSSLFTIQLFFLSFSVIIFVLSVVLGVISSIYFTKVSIDLNRMDANSSIHQLYMLRFNRGLLLKTYLEKLTVAGIITTCLFICIRIAELNSYILILIIFFVASFFLFSVLKILDIDKIALKNKKDPKQANINWREIKNLCIEMENPKLAIEGLSIGVFYKSFDSVGGDFYRIVSKDNHKMVMIVIGDIMGKGKEASIWLKPTVAIIDKSINDSLTPGETLKKANVKICDILPSNYFITASCITIDKSTYIVKWANAAHCPIIIYNPKIKKVKTCRFNPKNLINMLGQKKDAQYNEANLELAKDDILIQYTDGVYELKNGNGEIFGFERLKKVLINSKAYTPQQIAIDIEKALKKFIGNNPFSDDVAFIAIGFSNN